jgi:hypothetical protein
MICLEHKLKINSYLKIHFKDVESIYIHFKNKDINVESMYLIP